MKTQINRRAALTGAIASALSALPMTAQASSMNADAELFDLIRLWGKGKALENSIGAAHTEMHVRASANEPPLPPELLMPINLPSGPVNPTRDIGWTAKELEDYAGAKTTLIDKSKAIKNGRLVRWQYVTMPKDVRASAVALLAIKRNYDAVVEAHWREAEEGQNAFDEAVSANTDLIDQMAETPAHTLQGLLAKCRVCQTEHLFTHFMDFSKVAQSLVEDIERIAPRVQAMGYVA